MVGVGDMQSHEGWGEEATQRFFFLTECKRKEAWF